MSRKGNRRYRVAIFVSVAAHLIGAAVLLMWYLPGRDRSSPSPRLTDDRIVNERSISPSDVGAGNTLPPSAATASDLSAEQVPAEQISASIASQIEQVQNLPDERKLSELEKNLNRLEKVADPESVKDVTATIASTLGIDDETYQPKSNVPDEPLDPSTAQIQDVVRTKSESGAWQYESVLVDAEGRIANVPMSAADGQTTYETFQQMKKFPMAEGIYRSIVMPLIQKTLSASDAAKEAALKAERSGDQAR